MANGLYVTTHDVKVPFRISDFYGRKVIMHHFHVDNNKGESRIEYDMIIGCELIVHLVMKANFGYKIPEWDETLLPMKAAFNFLGKPNLNKHYMQEVFIQSAEPYSARETTEIVVKTRYSTYSNTLLYDIDVNAVPL